eukprot:m.53377 g.53377  ORF g.53377 m.53377 type:complete len:303 (+) comp21751_c1_seq1:428-1336(+)
MQNNGEIVESEKSKSDTKEGNVVKQVSEVVPQNGVITEHGVVVRVDDIQPTNAEDMDGGGDESEGGGEEGDMKIDDADKSEEDQDSEDNEPESAEEDVKEPRKDEHKEDKHKHLSDMKLIEEEYALLKDRLFNHRLAKVEDFLGQVREGILPRFVQQKKQLQTEMKKKLAIAEVLKSFRVINLDHQLTYSTRGAKEDYEDRAKSLKRKMLSERKARLRKIERDKTEMDRRFVPAPDPQSPHRKNAVTKTGTARRQSTSHEDGEDRRKKRKSHQTTSPLIVYMLNDREVDADLNKFTQGLEVH